MPRLTAPVEPDSLLVLTGYEPLPDADRVPDDRFVSAFRELAAREERPRGLVHRVLCQQVPAWNERVAAEMQEPIPFPFLDYAILHAEVDPASVPPLPPAILEGYRCVSASYQVAFRFVRPDPEGEPEALMFNLFEISGPPGMLEGFVMGWAPRGAFKAREPGFFSAMLHVAREPGARIAAFNLSEWRDTDHYARGIPAFEAAFPRAQRGQTLGPGGGPPPKVTSHLGMFSVAASISGAAPSQALRGAALASQAFRTMNAVVADAYGGPEVLRIEKVPEPAPAAGQVLLRVHAVDMTPLDTKLRSGAVEAQYPPWFPEIHGYCVAGVVEALGRGVENVRPGEEVYAAHSPIRRRGFAELAIVECATCEPKPANLSFAEAAAAIAGLIPAHNALFVAGALRAGQTVLVHGGSGAVGSFAVQLAKRAGARVIATASQENLDRLLALGADVAVDYRRERFEDHAKEVDLVIDTVGGETRARSFALLRRGGTLVTLVPPPPDPAVAAAHGVQAMMVRGHPRPGEVLHEARILFEAGHLQKPQIARVFPLEEAAAAAAYFDLASRGGRVVLSVGSIGDKS
jgi:NADPH:quinone reductase-like Zn-dependent oxidoreductase